MYHILVSFCMFILGLKPGYKRRNGIIVFFGLQSVYLDSFARNILNRNHYLNTRRWYQPIDRLLMQRSCKSIGMAYLWMRLNIQNTVKVEIFLHSLKTGTTLTSDIFGTSRRTNLKQGYPISRAIRILDLWEDYLFYSGERKLRSSRDQSICSTLHSTSLDLVLCIQGFLGLSSLNSLKHCKAQR